MNVITFTNFVIVMKYKSIPKETIGRLFIYFRALVCLSREGHKTVSSYKLAEICQLNPSIIRKDFSYFGELGKRGVGYNVESLLLMIRSELKLDPAIKIAIVGIGNIGKALLAYSGFKSDGFRIVAAFDSHPKKIGKRVGGLTVENASKLEKRVKALGIQMGILAVPESSAQQIVQRLAKGGVKAILSFAPCQLATPKDVNVICVDLSMEMARLLYYSMGQKLHKARPRKS